MSTHSIALTPQLYDYLQKNSLHEADVLKKLREQTYKMSAARMQISPEQGQFFQLLIQLMQAKKTLDIGVFTGYSALSVALALPENGKVIACDINKEWTKIAKKYWAIAGVTHKIDLKLAPANDTLQELLQSEAGTFDFAFIDADKANYANYYEKSLQLIRPGGLIAIDNVLWSGKVADPEFTDDNTKTIREFNQMIFNDTRITLSMLPIGDGLTLAFKKY